MKQQLVDQVSFSFVFLLFFFPVTLFKLPWKGGSSPTPFISAFFWGRRVQQNQIQKVCFSVYPDAPSWLFFAMSVGGSVQLPDFRLIPWTKPSPGSSSDLLCIQALAGRFPSTMRLNQAPPAKRKLPSRPSICSPCNIRGMQLCFQHSSPPVACVKLLAFGGLPLRLATSCNQSNKSGREFPLPTGLGWIRQNPPAAKGPPWDRLGHQFQVVSRFAKA